MFRDEGLAKNADTRYNKRWRRSVYIKGEWHATVEPTPDSESLAALAGIWNIGVDLKITNHFEYTSGPVEIKGTINPGWINDHMKAGSIWTTF